MGFGENLMNARKAKGISRKDFADQLDIPYTTLRNYETEQREPGHKLLIKMATLLSTSVDDLIGHHIDTKKAPSLSDEASKLAKDYDTRLDDWGQKAVRGLADTEIQRCEAEHLRRLTQKDAEVATEFVPTTKVIPLIGSSFAAGRGDPDFGNPWEDYEVPIDTEADFAVRINGDSMEPYLPDGSIQLCRKGDPTDGDVAALLLDGTFICKQVCKDMYGNLYLFSLNRNRSDADQTILHNSGQTVTCFGTVILPHKIPLP